MIERIDHIPLKEGFLFNHKNYVILRKEGNMSEVQDDSGRKWAWPNCARVAIKPGFINLI